MTELEERTYLYSSHLGGLYTNNEEYDLGDLYCETCGDYDTCLGSFQTVNEFWNLVKDEYYDIHYLFVKIVNIFDLPFKLSYADKVARNEEFCCNSKRYIADKLKELLGDDFEWNEELWGEINGNIITRRLS